MLRHDLLVGQGHGCLTYVEKLRNFLTINVFLVFVLRIKHVEYLWTPIPVMNWSKRLLLN